MCRRALSVPGMMMNTIPVETLQAWLAAGRPVTVLDVRPAAEREEWAIPGSLHADAYDALWAGDTAALAGVTLPAGAPVVTVCGEGKTSLLAAEQLRQRSIVAYSLAGGMRAWSLAWNAAEIGLQRSAARIVQVRRTGKGCLSYLIGSAGEAAVIDPSLDPKIYVELASEQGWRITAVLDTHVHADHLSRAQALAAQTGATLYLPAQAHVQYSFSPLSDGGEVVIGQARLVAVHTPGHTEESTSYWLDEEALFTGDTLFLNGVGRPDLHTGVAQARPAAQALYRSLQRISALPLETLILPAHSAEPAAFDGRPLVATLSEVQMHTTLLHLGETAFVTDVLTRIPPAPPNFEQIIALNQAGILPNDPTLLEAGANRCAVA
ncbi:MAG: MBL fold metallo-hydrolase [Chloroflexota bacterium]